MLVRRTALQTQCGDELEEARIASSPAALSPTPLKEWKGGKPTLNEAVLAFLKHNEKMLFVQVGGFDGVSFDPLRPFIQGGRLTGLIIEPLPVPFSKLEVLYAGSNSIKTSNCAIHAEDREQTMWRFKPSAIEEGILNSHFAGTSSFCVDMLLADDGSLGKLFSINDRTLMRSLDEPITVPCRTFYSRFDEYNITNVDLLQIGTEGYDLNILKMFDFSKYRPAIVSFEHIHLSAGAFDEAAEILKANGYYILKQDEDTLALCNLVFRGDLNEATSTSAHTAFDGVNGNVIFCMWTGSNPLTSNRSESLLSLYRETCCPVLFLSPNNIPKWELTDAPFHPAYEYLSETHKSDYLRCYIMHHFGGGYSDLKRTIRSWMPGFETLRASPNAMGLGYQEIAPQGVAPCGGAMEAELRQNYKKLLGNCAYIFKKNSPFTQRWIHAVDQLLDNKLESLKQNPAQHPMDQLGAILANHSVSAYPLRWTELLGEIFHPIAYEFRDSLLQMDIAPAFVDYR